MPELKDLGWANDWVSTPEIVVKCWEMKHEELGGTTSHHDYSRCIHSYECKVCGYRYREDSSG